MQSRLIPSVINVLGKSDFTTNKVMTKLKVVMECEMTDSQAAQIIFPSIVGTFKEDLGIFHQVTLQGTHITREELVKCFQSMTNSEKLVCFDHTELKVYWS